MSLVICEGGGLIALKALVNHTAQTDDLELHLFMSDTTPAITDVVGDYTEANFTGYAAITLTGTDFVVTALPIEHPKKTFESTASSQNQDVYGYYLTAGGVLIGAERFSDGPYNVNNNGDEVEVTLSIDYIVCGGSG